MWPVFIFVLTVIILVIYNNIINVIPVIIFPYVYSVSFIFKTDVYQLSGTVLIKITNSNIDVVIYSIINDSIIFKILHHLHFLYTLFLQRKHIL